MAQVAYDAAMVTAIATDTAAGNNNAITALTTVGVDGSHTNDHLDDALGRVLTSLLPRKILAKVKRSMRCDMRKPLE